MAPERFTRPAGRAVQALLKARSVTPPKSGRGSRGGRGGRGGRGRGRRATAYITQPQLVRSRGCKSGLVFNPGTSLDCLKYVMDKVDIVLLMSVNPGFGGQAFIPGTLDKLREARAMINESGYDISLQIDGGVSAQNIKEIAEAGADMFVAGSAIFNCRRHLFPAPHLRQSHRRVPPSWRSW